MVRRLLLLLVLATACTHREQPRPPIILISVDTLRSDHLPAYGYGRVATPNIDALRRDGVLFLHAYSHAPLTLPSHTSMLTGLLPTEHGVRNNIGYRLDGAKFPTLARRLREAGYRTGAAVSSFVLRSQTGIADGFDVYDDDVPVKPGAATAENQRSGFETLKRATGFVDRNASVPFFLFFHIYEPHAPYAPPEPFRSKVGDAYDGEIATADAIVGELIAKLKAQGVYDRAMIVFTSDHGEALWQHGEDQHGILLYREVLQVPLIVKYPGGARAGASEPAAFGLQRISGECLRAAGIATADRPSAPVYSETLYPRIHLGWSELRSLIDGRFHYIESSSPELYDLERDPGETRNVAGDERRTAANMRAALQSMPQGVMDLGAIDPEEAKKLAALGYIGTPKQRGGPLPNPREEIHVLRDLKNAFSLAEQHRDDEAIAAMRKLIAANPAMTDVSTRLAELLVASGRPGEAVEVYEAAIAHAPRVSPDLALALSIALLESGRNREAAQHAEAALSSSPFEAHEVIARAAIAEGRLADADPHVRLAVDADERSTRSLLLLAELQRARGQYDDALRTLDEASAHGGWKGVDHVRADLYARTDRPDDAIAAYRREIAHYPTHLQSYANLAVVYRILGRDAEASEVLEAMVRANPAAGARALAQKTKRAFAND